MRMENQWTTLYPDRLVGDLTYLNLTRPEITFSVGDYNKCNLPTGIVYHFPELEIRV
jgi:hypothetical protein